MKRLALILAATATASPAFAHSGHAFSFAAGLVHPFAGLDHLIAMALVGVWAAGFNGARAFVFPASFVAALALGAGLGHAGVAPQGLETALALTVAALGLMAAARARASMALGVAALAPLGLLHGLAHGAEAPQDAFALYAAGFLAASAALHAGGWLVGRMTARGARWIGAAGALAGVVLAIQ